MDDNQIFDDTLFSILKECKTLPAFLDNVFGFLNRRTDFYCVATTPNSPIGLPEGWAENYVRQSFYKYAPKKDDNLANKIPPAISHEEVVTTSEKAEQPRKLKDFTPSDSYNGANFENYTWSQTIRELDVAVKIPENVTSKQLQVDIKQKHLSVKLKADDTSLLDGELCNKCKHLDAIWSLDNRKLEIHLEKVSEIWWDCLLMSEPKLDVTKIDCSRPFDELSDEAQAKIEELTWNQERKRLGLPTTQEVLMQDTLKKAWNAEGSPFTGSFDPGAVQFHS